MATISYYTFASSQIFPSDTTYLTSGDGYLHVFNYGPLDLIANNVSVPDPVSPSDGIPLKAGEWTLIPADTEGAGSRIGFAQIANDTVTGGIQLSVWTV